MNKKIITGFLGLVLVAVFGIIAYRQSQPSGSSQTPTVSPNGNNAQVDNGNTPPSAPVGATRTKGYEGDDDYAPSQTPTGATAPTGSNTNPSGSSASSYTLSQIAGHATASSCWSAINGGVYDLTNWIVKHPGGQQAILSICGKDGSAAFNNQHYGSQKIANLLASFKIGTLSAN